MNEAIREQLSAYVDGELPENEAELLIRRMSQDSQLRAEVAEYLALGRIMRDSMGLAAADNLNERVAAVLDDTTAEGAANATDSVPSRSLKLLGGAAIAATVALAAIFGLQQTGDVEEGTSEAPTVATVPAETSQQEKQRMYLLNHAEMSTDLGANGIEPRLVTLELDEEAPAETDEDAADETVAQP